MNSTMPPRPSLRRQYDVLVLNKAAGGEERCVYTALGGFNIGSEAGSQVVLDSPLIGRRHVVVDRGPDGFEFQVSEDAADGVVVQGRTIGAGERAAWPAGAELHVATFVVRLRERTEAEFDATAATGEPIRLLRSLHTRVLSKMELRLPTQTTPVTLERLEQAERLIDEQMAEEFVAAVEESAEVREHFAAQGLEMRLSARLYNEPRPTGLRAKRAALQPSLESDLAEFVDRIWSDLELTLRPENRSAELERIERKSGESARSFLNGLPVHLAAYVVRGTIKKHLFDMMFGLGPLQELLDSPDITEIMIVHPNLVYVERGGEVTRVARSFISDAALTSVIERIVAPLGRRIDRSSPLVDARLPDGARVNAIIPPLALKGPCLTIRRFPKAPLSMADLRKPTRDGPASLTAAAAEILRAAVVTKRNIVIAGGTGTGKTSVLGALSALISPKERLITIEDAAELNLPQQHVISLETKPPNSEGAGEYTIRDLVRNALRMRPDRIIVGECRGAEAVDMIQAMNTGHAGSMTTVHANSARDAVGRLETMLLMGVEMPLAAVRQQIARAINVIIFLERQGRQRLVSEAAEVTGINPVTGEIEVETFLERPTPRASSSLTFTGFMPTFLSDAVRSGVLDPDVIFSPGTAP